MINRRRSYTRTQKTIKKRSKHRSRKVKKKTKTLDIKKNIFSTQDIINKSGLVNNPKSHEYEDRVSKYIDPNGEFVMIGLFDSHSGIYSSVKLAGNNGLLEYIAVMLKNKHISSQLLNEAFKMFDNRYLSKTDSGSTATVIYFSKKSTYIANVGDSPAYSISQSLQKPGINIQQLSIEHDYFNTKERQRVFKSSINKNVWDDQRVHGIIQSARGMGDFEIKTQEPGVFINNPSIVKLNRSNIKYLMITSDGVTDPFTEKYETKNLLNGYPGITDKQMLKNSIKNFKSVINEYNINDPINIINSIIKLVKQKVKGDYQDDISVIIMNVKEIFNLLN